MVGGVFKAAASVGALSAASRILGFVRDAALAALLGAGPAADAFFVAFRLPDLMRRLFADGAFSAAITPLLAARLAKDPCGAEPWRFAGRCLVSLAALGALLAGGAALGAERVILALAPGFAADPERLATAAALLRLLAPYAGLLLLTAGVAAGLNALDRFAAAAAAPLLLNGAMLLGCAVLWLGPSLAVAPATLLAASAVFGGIVQLVWVWGAARRAGATPRWGGWRLDQDPDLRLFWRRLGPGAAAAGATQAALVVGVMLASIGPAGAVAQLYFADRLAQLPQGLIGGALGTSLGPALARLCAQNDAKAAAALVKQGLIAGAALSLPASVGLWALATPIVAGLLGRGAFDAAAAAEAGGALAWLAVGLPAGAAARILAPACFAAGRYRAPMAAALLSAALVAPLGWLGRESGAVGVAAALAVAAWSNGLALAVVAAQAGLLRGDRVLLRAVSGIAAAAAVMGVVAWAAQAWLAARLPPLAALFAAIFLGAGLYAAVAPYLAGRRPRDLLRRAASG